MAPLRIVALDITLSNLGWCEARWVDGELSVVDVGLVQTEKVDKAQRKRVSARADLFNRARAMSTAVDILTQDADVVMSEVPHGGGQSASAIWSFGITVGILAGVIGLIEVAADDAKAVTGDREASKADVIAWATRLYPSVPWIRDRGKSTGRIVARNEHIADAIAVLHAGIDTQQFRDICDARRHGRILSLKAK